MPDEIQEYWHDFYKDYLSRAEPWLDYSIDPERAGLMQAMTFGVTLSAAGSVWGKSCLDVGCGKGHLSLALEAFGAREVVAVDYVEAGIDEQRAKHPHSRVCWTLGNVADPHFVAGLGSFDIVFIVELIQYLPYRAVLSQLWEKVKPGGRLVGVTPNGANKYVREAVNLYEGRYDPPTSTVLQEILQGLPEVALWGLMGMLWRPDQRLIAYDLSPLAGPAHFKAEPKRLLFVARKGPLPAVTSGETPAG